MKTLFLICILSIAAFGQKPTFSESPLQELDKIEAKPTPTPYTRPPTKETAWKLIADSATDGTTWSYRTWRKGSGDDAEVWIKVAPKKPVKLTQPISLGSRRTTTKYISYSLQFTTLHCGDSRYSVETIIPYDARGNPIEYPSFGVSLFCSPTVPGSVIEYIYKFFCR